MYNFIIVNSFDVAHESSCKLSIKILSPQKKDHLPSFLGSTTTTMVMISSHLVSHCVSSSSSSRDSVVVIAANRRATVAVAAARLNSGFFQHQHRQQWRKQHIFPRRRVTTTTVPRNNTSSSDSSKIEERTIRRRVFVRRSAYGRSSNHDGVEEDNSFENSTRREEKDWELKLFNVDDGTNTAAAKIWTVPWSLSHVAVVMMLWIVSFLWAGQSFVPWATFYMGFDAEALTSRGVAVYSLFADIAACVVSIFCVWFGTRKYQEELKNTNWFRVTFESVEELKRCLKETLLFVATFPLVNLIAEVNSKLCDYFASSGTSNLTNTQVTVNPSNFERVAMSGDGISVLFYAILVAIVAPIWEEVIFRGFLMPSLTKKWRISTSICLSSCIFALAHFSLERFLPLTALSIALSILYVRTRNVVAPIVLHALWNAAAVLEATDAFDVLLEGLLEALGVLVGA